MGLNVQSILYTPGRSLPFSLELDLSGLEFNGRFPAAEPVRVEGRVTNRAGVLELELTARTTLHAACDRCGKPFPLDKEVSCRCLLSEELQNEDSDDIVLLENGAVDVEDLARTAFVLDMDGKTLCSEDCKGLCPRCGANLNEGPCSCKPEPDPRWAALARLLE